MFGVEPDLALVQRLKTALEGKLDAYDVTLGKTKYLAGDVSSDIWTQYRDSHCKFCRLISGCHPRRPSPLSLRRTARDVGHQLPCSRQVAERHPVSKLSRHPCCGLQDLTEHE